MPFDGARAQEELRADLRVRMSLGGEACDLQLLWSELVPRLVPAGPNGLSGRHQLSARAFGEAVGAEAAEQLVREAELLARVHAPALPAQPLAVEDGREPSRKLSGRPCARELEERKWIPVALADDPGAHGRVEWAGNALQQQRACIAVIEPVDWQLREIGETASPVPVRTVSAPLSP